MAQEAWKVLVRQRTQEAADRCTRAHGLIADVLGELGTPEPVPDVPAWRGRAQRAEGVLADAIRDLADAASLMAAARLIALRGAAASPAPAPAAPPRSTDANVPGADEVLRFGVGKLQDARACAGRACFSVEMSRAHLCFLRLLLDHPHLPGLDGLLDAKRVSARGHLNAARKHEEESIKLAAKALVWLS